MKILEKFDLLLRKQSARNISKLKEFFKFFLLLIHDRYVVTGLTTVIEESQKEIQQERGVNHVEKSSNTGHEL